MKTVQQNTCPDVRHHVVFSIEEQIDEITSNGIEGSDRYFLPVSIIGSNWPYPNYVKIEHKGTDTGTVVYFFDFSELFHEDIRDSEVELLKQKYKDKWLNVGTVSLKELKDDCFKLGDDFVQEAVNTFGNREEGEYFSFCKNEDKGIFFMLKNIDLTNESENMKRQLTSHLVTGQTLDLQVTVEDQPGPGNACHEYLIRDPHGVQLGYVRFQKGPISEKDYNGMSNEVLLAIVKDRLEGFQSGPFACDENQSALDSVNDALETLKLRTQRRIARNVEGTSKV